MMLLKKLTVYSQGFHNKTKRLMRYSKLHVNMTMNIKVKAVKLTKERPWKYQALAEAMKEICSGDECNDTYGWIWMMYQALLLK